MVFFVLSTIFMFIILTLLCYIFQSDKTRRSDLSLTLCIQSFIFENKHIYLTGLIFTTVPIFKLWALWPLFWFICYYSFATSSRFSYRKIFASSRLLYPNSWYGSYLRQQGLDEIFKISLKKLIIRAIRSIFSSILGIFKTNYHDVMVAFGLKELNGLEGQEIAEKYFQLQKRIFKYVKPQYMRLVAFGTAEEILTLQNKLKFQKDPKKPINTVRRLPWFFNYSVAHSLEINWVKKNLLPFYNFFKTTIVALVMASLYFIYTIYFFKIQFLKQLSIWFIIGMLFFWLMSGFNFFFKRYRYGKFTSAIQRFWKRTNACFWLIEGFLILIFFYYYLNSSQEPVYMYDYSGLNQEYLISLHTVVVNVILLSLVIYFMYFVLLRLNSNSWSQLSLYLVIISFFIFYSFFIETYQVYYVISTFNERFWSFNEEENLWSIEVDNPVLRTKQQYFLVCLIAKYWHFLFIFLSWVFFLMKSYERKSVNFVNFGVNIQNLVILYILNLMCYIQWIKWVYRRFLDIPYTWFFTNIDNKFLYRLFWELKFLMQNLFNPNIELFSYETILYKSISLWNVDSLSIWKYL